MVSADLTYEFNYPLVRGRITGFFTRSWNGTELNGYYDDETRTFVNQTLTGIERRFYGFEVAAAFKLGTYFTLIPVASLGDYRYANDAMSLTCAENGMPMTQDDVTKEYIFEVRDKVLLKGLHLSTGPQANASLKLAFFHPKMWFGDEFANAIETTDGAPVSYTMDADGTVHYDNAVLDNNGVPVLRYPYNLMTMQESLAATNPLNRFLIDLSVGKLIYLPNRQSLSLNLSVTNITNNTHFKTGGYQQARLPRATRQGEADYHNSVITANAWKFPSKYYYAWGANFFFTVTYKF